MGRTEFRKSPPPRSTIEIRMALPKNHIICPSHILGTMTCSAEPKICDLPQLCPFFLPLFTKELPNDVEKYGKMISCSRGGSVSCGRPGRKANLFPALDPKKNAGETRRDLGFPWTDPIQTSSNHRSSMGCSQPLGFLFLRLTARSSRSSCTPGQCARQLSCLCHDSVSNSLFCPGRIARIYRT